jgi:hypothetical protein
MKIKTAEDIYDNMANIIPYALENHLKPYIIEAMEIYADQFRPKESNWRGSFEVYLTELNKVYQELLNDAEWIKKQEKYHPGVDIKLSLEKAVENFWGQESGWQYKKRKKSKDLNWKATLTKAIDLNKVWLPRNQQQQNIVVYNKPKFLE